MACKKNPKEPPRLPPTSATPPAMSTSVDDIEAEVHRLQALGARRIDEGVQSFGGTRWVRMSDPQQNDFCFCTGVEW
jgi:predicted enzyme related to lactoylglutathione lyase